VPEHFRRNYDTFNEIFFKKIINGGSLRYEIRRLRETAKKYINRATVAKKANIALRLSQISNETVGIADEEEIRTVLFHLTDELYDFVHDDLFIVAAFENYAKATLLAKRYVVHIVKKPNSLYRKQKTNPIHIQTIRSNKHLPNLRLEHYTIGVNTLLKPNYFQLLSLSDKAEKAIHQCRHIRNQIHFGGPKMIGSGPGLYNGLIELTEAIERQPT